MKILMDLQTSASPALLKVPVLSNSVNLGISPLEHRLVEGRHLSKAQSQPSTLENSQDFLPSELLCSLCKYEDPSLGTPAPT